MPRRVLAALLLTPIVAAGLYFTLASPKSAVALQGEKKKEEDRPKAPDLDGGLAWLNTAGPIKMADLRGKVVLLDFWTLCCINCIHIMPDLVKLEKKYPNEFVVIGVHSAKFDNEKETRSIRQAILRYEIAHPVVNDAEHKIWDRYGVSSWPTQVLIDTEGRYVGSISGEGNLETIDATVGKLIEEGKKRGTLNDKPIRFDLIRYRDTADAPLFFPGKILADDSGDRLFIADSTHHRLVITDLNGKKKLIVGTGTPGFKDGPAADAQFDDPQGMALDGDTLYIADRKNHAIRTLDLKKNVVSTLAGTGQQDGDFQSRMLQKPVGAKSIGLNSPWDLLLDGRRLFIAMAGHHQIWVMDLDAKTMQPFAGTGRENIKDGPLYAAHFAQPSGLAKDDKYLYVADSETSAIRKIPLNGEGRVTTLVGEGLFEFGDVDGVGEKARIQHALAVAMLDGKLILADTYNNKLKKLDPLTRNCTTWLGGDNVESWFRGPLFNEPAGMSIANGKLYVADTNASRIRVVDLKTNDVWTLQLEGVTPPPQQKDLQPGKEKK